MAKARQNTENLRQRTCDTMPVHERFLRTIPNYVEARNDSENGHRNFLKKGRIRKRKGITVIPAVVHIVYKTEEQNISESQVISQLDVLNRDFRKKNLDISRIPEVFHPLAEDAQIEFELASKDADGKETNRITRTHTKVSRFSSDDQVKSSDTGGQDPWDTIKYLNIWVCELKNLLGYAQFPGGPAETDGVVISHSAFGTEGTAAAPFNLGRTATHEIGHWLNLRHIWGDDGTGCHGSDHVNDTPNQGGPNRGTPDFPHITCGNKPNGDLFMNYMDYVDDQAMIMFTSGQIDRMHACLENDRSSFGT